MYELEVKHPGLGKYRHIRGKDRYVVQQKAHAQKVQWDEMWERRQATENARSQKEAARLNAQKLRTASQQAISNKKDDARLRTEEATAAWGAIDDILLITLGVDDRINWDAIKDKSPFSEAAPTLPSLKAPPPMPSEQTWAPRLGWLDMVFKSLRIKKEKIAQEEYRAAYDKWLADKSECEQKNSTTLRSYQKAEAAWEMRKHAFEADRTAQYNAIDRLKESYEGGDSDAILEYCDLVLSRSNYPDYFPQQFELEYTASNKTLLVDYVLPHINVLPRLKEVAYVQSRDEFKESELSESQLNKIYDKLLYDITLRTIHELFEADTIGALDAVVFNGWVQFASPATGKDVNACILSLQAIKQEFMEINLGRVESKTCFKNLKGVGSSKLHSMTAVAPILQMQREDKRFISSYGVAAGLDDSVNLAQMDWQDFEHLVREIFEKEFAIGDGEVRVTQSSRDGGVDAVIFDPDPIRGGKIVVQAKRYTNTVGVASVRDLYGTVMNEGANKGILITTSDYGPDAYSFANGKPLTLLNGSGLLYLLEKHGHSARIDLQEAKMKVS